jgi:hypothetical protein
VAADGEDQSAAKTELNGTQTSFFRFGTKEEASSMGIFSRFFSNDWFQHSQQDDKDNSERPDLSRLFHYLQSLDGGNAEEDKEDDDKDNSSAYSYNIGGYTLHHQPK